MTRIRPIHVCYTSNMSVDGREGDFSSLFLFAIFPILGVFRRHTVMCDTDIDFSVPTK